MPPQPLYDISKIDFTHPPLYDIEAIRRMNPQRNQMEQLTGVVYVDTENHGLVGYKDVTPEEFWVSGHMPGFPLMPGVILCEAAAQLASFYSMKYKILGGDFVGFGGMEDVRFRSPVYPPARLIIAAKMKEMRKGRLAKFEAQGYVGDTFIFSGIIIGVPIFRRTHDHAPHA